MRYFIIGCLLSLGVAALCPQPARAAPGSEDTTFGVNGVALITADYGAEGNAVAVQSDGKIVIAGQAFEGFGTREFFVSRLNSNGTPDTTFGGTGIVTTSFDDVSYATAVAIQPSDGKIVVAGISYPTSGLAADVNSLALARYTTSGALDTTFGTGGKVSVAIGKGGSISSVVIQGSQILVAGTVLFNGTNLDFLLIRFNSSGGLDHCFGETSFCFNLSGSVHTDFGGQEQAFALSLQSDGKIVAAGCFQVSTSSDSQFAVARYNSNGLLDTTFGRYGRVVTDITANDDQDCSLGEGDAAESIAQQADGKLVVAGRTGIPASFEFSPALVRYNTNGSLDTGFGSGGKVKTNFGESAHAVVIQPDGRIAIAAGWIPVNGVCCRFALARFNANGSLDTSFGNYGIAVSDVRGQRAFALAIQQILLTGRLIAVGDSNNVQFTAAARFEAYTITLTRVGTFALAPAVSTAAVLEPFDYAFTWTVPDPENWHDLTSLSLRIRDGSDVIFAATFDESTQTFSVLNAAGISGPSAAPGSNQVLETPDAALDMADAKVIASGATSPTVTLLLPLSLKPRTAGRSFVVEVAASDDFGNQSGVVQAGTLDVQLSK
jgi:uncharacterized delta-60 repeat protein